MPASLSEDVLSYRLNESTFLASQMPKEEIGAARFIDDHPEYDGRGVLIAIFDSGIDPAADGLQKTSDGKPKIIDIIDCTGSNDIDTSKVVKADANGHIMGGSGSSLAINPTWRNPSGEWHVGYKFVYELFTDTLTNRVKKERKKRWNEKNQEAISEALKLLSEFDKKHNTTQDSKLKKTREDFQDKIDFLRNQINNYDDKGPIIDAVVWNDGEVWRVALDTQSLEDDSNNGKLADFNPLTNYRIEQKYGTFSKLDACSFVTNVYNEGNILSLVTDCSLHGTHVAGIAAAFHPHQPLLNGVAPGAQLISCKIGDSRLGSMETGTGLTRALIAAVEHKCDLINMSYGEPSLLPDYGRFVDLVNEVVNKHRLIFVSSAGNSGPALGTVGAPGGTSSSIIGVGAYVSPSMAAGAHCVVEAPSDGLEYTWSSRGPTADGDLGVCISAPGGAVAPVPTWTLQHRMLLNGTSMASPSACGGIALLVSGMKAEGIPVSPYSVRRALENTTVSIGVQPEDKLTTGQGLLQVHSAYEYICQTWRDPSVWYEVFVSKAGTSNSTSRGIYLRDSLACRQISEWVVEIVPKFHEDASNLKELVPFEECIQLCSTEKSIIQAPEYLLLTNNGRTFNVIVDPTNLCNGLHYYEVYGIDCKAPWRGPLFRVPVTITKPMILEDQPIISFQSMKFIPGHIERKFIWVPMGATWIEATMRTSGFDTSRIFYINVVQVSPLKRPIKWEKNVMFTSPTIKSFIFPVQSGQTMELVVAQLWSSGLGCHDATIVDVEITFHGIIINKNYVLLDGSEAPTRIAAKCLLSSEKLEPSALLNKIRLPHRPVDSTITPLPTSLDKLMCGSQILSLMLTYKFKLNDGARIKPHLPLLNDRIYDTQFESQIYMIFDSNKRVYAVGDAYPKSVKIPKGDYTLKLHIRHENVQCLEKMRNLVFFIDRELEEKECIRLNFFSEPDGHIMGNGSFKSSILSPGKEEAFFVSPPIQEKIPKNCPPGSVLLGSVSYGKLSAGIIQENQNKHVPVSYQISYIVPPIKMEENKGKNLIACTKSVTERLQEEIRDTKIRFLSNLKEGIKQELVSWQELSASLKSEYPKYTPLLAEILDGIVSRTYEEENTIKQNEEIVNASNEVIDSINRDELARYFSFRTDPEDCDGQETMKIMKVTRDQLSEALYQKGLALSALGCLKETVPSIDSNNVEKDETQTGSSKETDLFEENFKELKRWVDVKSSKFAMLLVLFEMHHGRLGTALKVLNDLIQESEPPKKKHYDMKISLLERIGWTHLSLYEKQWMYVRFPPSLPLF